jgi:hypothetical protein
MGAWASERVSNRGRGDGEVGEEILNPHGPVVKLIYSGVVVFACGILSMVWMQRAKSASGIFQLYDQVLQIALLSLPIHVQPGDDGVGIHLAAPFAGRNSRPGRPTFGRRFIMRRSWLVNCQSLPILRPNPCWRASCPTCLGQRPSLAAAVAVV